MIVSIETLEGGKERLAISHPCGHAGLYLFNAGVAKLQAEIHDSPLCPDCRRLQLAEIHRNITGKTFINGKSFYDCAIIPDKEIINQGEGE